jgi:hypothetical protein
MSRSIFLVGPLAIGETSLFDFHTFAVYSQFGLSQLPLLMGAIVGLSLISRTNFPTKQTKFFASFALALLLAECILLPISQIIVQHFVIPLTATRSIQSVTTITHIYLLQTFFWGTVRATSYLLLTYSVIKVCKHYQAH